MGQMLAFALAPIFFGLLLGYFAGLRKLIEVEHLRGLMVFIMSFALPCALFQAIVRVPRSVIWSQGYSILIMVVLYLATFGAMYAFACRVLGESAGSAAVLGMTVGFPNLTAVGLPLLESVYGGQTLILVAIGLALGSLTLSPLTLAVLEDSTPSGHSRSGIARMATALFRACRRSVIWAPAAGVACVLLEISMPAPIQRCLTVVGSATAGGALFLTGVIISGQKLYLNWKIAFFVTAKNIVQPGLCLAFALLVGMPMAPLRWLVLAMAVPCGFFGIVFGEGFDVHSDEAGSALAFSYLFSIVTLAGWIVLLEHMR